MQQWHQKSQLVVVNLQWSYSISPSHSIILSKSNPWCITFQLILLYRRGYTCSDWMTNKNSLTSTALIFIETEIVFTTFCIFCIHGVRNLSEEQVSHSRFEFWLPGLMKYSRIWLMSCLYVWHQLEIGLVVGHFLNWAGLLGSTKELFPTKDFFKYFQILFPIIFSGQI